MYIEFRGGEFELVTVAARQTECKDGAFSFERITRESRGKLRRLLLVACMIFIQFIERGYESQ